MKVLLLQAYTGRKEKDGNIFPIGLCYIATAIANKGHDVKVLDLNLYDDPYTELEKVMKEFDPAIAGISLRNIDTTQKLDLYLYYKTIQPTARLIKDLKPGILLMIGGTGFSMFAMEIMKRVPELDFGVFLEGDESAPDLLDHLDEPEKVAGLFVRKGKEVLFTGHRPLPDINKISMPTRDFIDTSKYSWLNMGVQTKRGCPLKCAYCSYPFLNGAKIRQRSPKDIVDELEYMKNEFNITKFMFADSIFNLPRGHAEAVCHEIINRGLKVEWAAWYDIKNFTDELMRLSNRAGCISMAFSPDAASDESLKALGKSATEKDIYNVISIAKMSKGIKFGFSFFCTPPKQDFIGFLKTLKLFFYIIWTLTLRGKGGAGLGWIRVEPDTKMHRIAIEEGMLKESDNLLPEDAEGLKKYFYSSPATRFYADPIFSFMMHSFSETKSFVKFLKKSNQK